MVLNLLSPFFFTLPKNVKLDVLIRIQLKRLQESFLSNKPIVYVTKVATTCPPMFKHLFDTIIVASMGGGWPRAKSSAPGLSPGQGHCVVFLGNEPWPGALCCVLGHDTLLSQCLFPPRSGINGYQQAYYWG